MTNLILLVIIAAFITILVRKYAVPVFFKVVAIPGQIVPIVNVVLLVIIFALSFGGFRYVLPSAEDMLVHISPQLASEAELEQLQQQRELVRAEQLRQEQAQLQLELERLNRDKAQRLAELEQLRQAQAAAEQQQQEQEAQRQAELARKQAAENLVRSYYEALNRQDADAAISKRLAVADENKLRRRISKIEWFRINDVRVGTVSEESAEVYVDVIGKNADSNQERWSGTINLKWAGSEWKIEDMKGLKPTK